MAVELKTVTEDEADMRLDRWFKLHYPDLSFGHLQKLVRTGQVRVDGGRVKTSSRLAAGQSVRIPPLGGDEDQPADERGRALRRSPGRVPPAPPPARADTGREVPAGRGARKYLSDSEYLRSLILYEDRDVMVLNKPFGLAVQGGSGITRHVDGLLETMTGKDGQRPRLVHRIDKDTSGCLLIAKSRLAASVMAKSFRSREARKVYWAVVPGVPKPRQGRISTYLARDEEEERMRVARHGENEASHAVTYYAVVDQAAQK